MHLEILMVFAAAVINSSVALETFKLEYFLSGQNLGKTDELGHSDPYAVVFIRQGDGNAWIEDKETAYAVNTHNPVWKEKFKVEYRSGKNTYIRVDVHDKDHIESDYLGYVEFDVFEFLRKSNWQVTGPNQFFDSVGKLTGKYIDKGTIKVHHRITEITGYRSAAPLHHLTLPYNALLVLSLNYFLRI